MTIKRSIILVAVALTMGSANATTLTSKINLDNRFEVFLSTDDSSAGTSFGVGTDWRTTFTDTTVLSSGVDYYLHVRGVDVEWIAGFLGEFSLTGTDHLFSNSSTELLTNTTDWVASTLGFDGTYGATVLDLGDNGVGPWGTRSGVSNDATWIWADNAYDINTAYFSTKITADVREPGTFALFGLGLAGLTLARRKKAQ
jgi:MSHA biogenesis protein MshQ